MAAPVVAISDHTLRFNEWAQIDNWLSYFDADGNPAVSYQFWDSGAGADSGYFWTPTNAHWAANTVIDVNASDVDKVWLRGGTNNTSETMWVRAFDGTAWSSWDTFTLTTHNDPPTATIADHTLNWNQWVQVGSWVNYSDPNGDAAVKYQFWDSGAGADSGYFWTSTNAHWAANTVIDVNASDLSNVWVRGGTDNTSETMWVRANDGNGWGNWDLFTLTTHDNPPVATVADQTLNIGEWARMSNWISYSDADGDAATKYQFWDSGSAAGSGSFWTPNGYAAPNTVLDVAASDLSTVWVQGGTANGTDSMWVRAFDGHTWGNWDVFTLTTHDDPPVATISDHSLAVNEWARVSDWLNYSDANGDAATRYQFWDAGSAANSGYFWTPSNAQGAPNTTVDVNAADLSTTWVRGGAAAGTDSMWVRAFDGHVWGNWDLFTLTTHA